MSVATKKNVAFVTSLVMTSWFFDHFHVLHGQFYMISDQFEKGDDQNWSQKPQAPYF